MALSTVQRRKLLEMNLPASKVVREQLRDYLGRTGLTGTDFGRRINYSGQSVNKFLTDAYEQIAGTDASLRAAIIEFIAAHPVGVHEQANGPLHETENVRLIRRYFNEALNRGRACYFEGDPGTQKSFVLQHLVAELNREELSKNGHGKRAYYIYCPQKVSRCGLMKRVGEATGSLLTGEIDRVIRNLRFDFMSRRALLIFDEAQHLSVDCFETLRELHDRPPHFGLLFAGSHQLARMFARYSLELEQWNSRFFAGKRLPGITEDEAVHIASAEIPELPRKKLDVLLKGARAKALGSEGQHEYISARRLFSTIAEYKEQLQAKGASA